MQPKETNEALAARAKAGDRAALGALWEQNRGLLSILLRRLASNPDSLARMAAAGVTFEDLMQESYFAVELAAPKYDPARGALFATFLPYAVQRIFFRAIGMRTARQRREPLCKADSLDRPLTSGPGFDLDNLTLADAIPDDAAAQQLADVDERIFTEQLRAALDECLGRIPERAAEAIRARYYKGQIREQIAASLGCSVQGVQRAESNGMRKLREPLNRQRLEPYRQEIITSHAMRGTGFSTWEAYGSVQERTIEELERRWIL